MSGTDLYDHLFKILIIGDSGVGKSNILLRYVDGMFSEEFISTIGVDFRIHTLQIENKNVKLQLWDTAGQDRFKSIVQSYYRGAAGILVVYDVTNRESFENINQWINEVQRLSSEAQLVLVANKIDLSDKAKVTSEEGKSLALQFGIPFFEVSAKSNSNIDECILTIAKTLVNKEKHDIIINDPFNPNLKKNQKKTTCC